MRRSKLLALGVASLCSACFGIVLTSCGSSDNSNRAATMQSGVPGVVHAATTAETQPTPKYEESTDNAVVEAGSSYGIAESATGVGYEKLDARAQLEAAEAYLHSSLGKPSGTNIGAHALVAAVEQFILKGNITDELTTIFSEAITEIEAKQRAREDAISEQKEAHQRMLLENRAAVGKTGPEVEQLLGPPEQPEEIGGERLWYYRVLSARRETEEWQLVFSGTTVASENQY